MPKHFQGAWGWFWSVTMCITLLRKKIYLIRSNRVEPSGHRTTSDVMFVTCIHACDLIRYIRNNEQLLSQLYACPDSRSVFVEAFQCKLKQNEFTEPILRAKCSHGHEFKENIKRVVGTMFNIFALNITREMNDKIHADRKRKNNEEDPQKGTSILWKQKSVSLKVENIIYVNFWVLITWLCHSFNNKKFF